MDVLTTDADTIRYPKKLTRCRFRSRRNHYGPGNRGMRFPHCFT